MRRMILTAAMLFAVGIPAMADDTETVVSLAGGKFTMTGPKGWTKKTPRVNIIESEFEIPKSEGDSAGGRLTVMQSGGGIEANVARWKTQFAKTDKSATTKEKIGDFEVHIVDLAGTFKEQRGPFAPATMKEDYRMLAAIIVLKDSERDYFVKLTGPKKTIEANAKKFKEFVKTFKAK